DAVPSFVNPDTPTNDFHLNPAVDLAFIDHGNPAAPPDGAMDIDGDPRVIGGTCPLNPVRDIGADEFNPGILDCAPPPPPPPPPPPSGAGAPRSQSTTGLRAAALKKCKRKHGAARMKCIRRARPLPR